VLGLYAGEAAGVRLHVNLRWRSCPFVSVADHVPASGPVLDVGCGHGLLSCYLALAGPAREVVGIDVDEARIDVARRAGRRAAGHGAKVRFGVARPGELPDGPWAAIAIVDVLYLLPRAAQRLLLAECAGRLAPGGVLVVKEMDVSPRWKAALARAQETIAVRLLAITTGEHIGFTPPRELAQWLEEAGLAVEHLPLHRGRPHPHHLLVGTRNGGRP
jgi:2-polyprenyl-3-methyl-5-hydroxy-6-metoxy-1,4-benzoquinol methylase